MKIAVSLLCLLIGFQAQAIGTVSEHRGTACEIVRGKNKLSGIKGAEIQSMDTYVTGACVGNITFRDDTRVKVNENSRLLIDDFVFDPRASDAGRLAIKVSSGTVRYASGQIAKNNPQQVNIKTPTAAIAVRGTDFNMTVDETGASLVILVPSCRDETEVKKYELEENRCRVGSITVTNDAGSVTLDRAFEATFVASLAQTPTAPAVVTIVESQINNNLIIVKPVEVQRAMRDSKKNKKEEEDKEAEAETARRPSPAVQQGQQVDENTRILEMTTTARRSGCNPATSVCVIWERAEEPNMQSRGRGTAFRNTENEHYAEVKTLGYVSNTTVTITHNDAPAAFVIGDGSLGGTRISIKQNNGVLRPNNSISSGVR
jgi:hypothetical protein